MSKKSLDNSLQFKYYIFCVSVSSGTWIGEASGQITGLLGSSTGRLCDEDSTIRGGKHGSWTPWGCQATLPPHQNLLHHGPHADKTQAPKLQSPQPI